MEWFFRSYFRNDLADLVGSEIGNDKESKKLSVLTSADEIWEGLNLLICLYLFEFSSTRFTMSTGSIMAQLALIHHLH